MSVKPEMPFQYKGIDTEAMGHLISARVVELLEPIIRRLVWDAIDENLRVIEQDSNRSQCEFNQEEWAKEKHKREKAFLQFVNSKTKLGIKYSENFDAIYNAYSEFMSLDGNERLKEELRESDISTFIESPQAFVRKLVNVLKLKPTKQKDGPTIWNGIKLT